MPPTPADMQPAPDTTAAKPSRRSTAEEMGKKQRSIAVSEFFYKNRHLLGFDNPRKALLTTIKEAVDNSLDACEEAGILPDIGVAVEQLAEERFRVRIADNGPGIVKQHVGPVFGKLLYGSKFHRLKMSRGQQGIGISAAGMYAMMTTGRAVEILTRTSGKRPAYWCELQIDTKQNIPIILKEAERDDCPFEHGTSVTMELQAKYQKGRASVDEYLELTAIANPHAKITWQAPAEKGRPAPPPVVFQRGSETLPAEAKEIKPHPYGVELGVLLKMLQDSTQPTVLKFLVEEFCTLSAKQARELIKAAGLTEKTAPRDIGTRQAEPLYNAIQRTAWHRVTSETFAAWQKESLPPDAQGRLKTLVGREFATEKLLLDALKKEKILEEDQIRRFTRRLTKHTQPDLLPAPPTDCLAPIGVPQILKGLLKELKAEFFTAETREPAVYRGMPFQIEVGLAWGGGLGGGETTDEDGDPAGNGESSRGVPTRLVRFANRVPLLYQQSACVTFKAAAEDVEWKPYIKMAGGSVDHTRGALPTAPMVLMIHMASVWVPFTSESKEAIADYDAIRDEIRLGLQECARRLRAYLRKKERVKGEAERRSRFFRYIDEVVAAIAKITRADEATRERFRSDLVDIATKRTARADSVFDDSGKEVRRTDDDEELSAENTIIVESAATALPAGADPAGTETATSAAASNLEMAPLPDDLPPPEEG